MIYLENTTSAQTISIPYTQSDQPATKQVEEQKNFTVTERGQYTILPDSGYTSMAKVSLNVNTPSTEDAYASGRTDGINYQKSLLTGVTITENGDYVRPDGYSAVTVSVTGVTEPFFGKYFIAPNIIFDIDIPYYEGANNPNLVRFEMMPKNVQRVFQLYVPTFAQSIGEITGITSTQGNIKMQTIPYETYQVTGGNKNQSFTRKVQLPLTFDFRWDSKVPIFNKAQYYMDSHYYFNDYWGIRGAFLENYAGASVSDPVVETAYLGLGGSSSGDTYIKSIRLFGSDFEANIVARSDGKLYDTITNTEVRQNDSRFWNFRWRDINGGDVPTTFNTIYEWEIPK